VYSSVDLVFYVCVFSNQAFQFLLSKTFIIGEEFELEPCKIGLKVRPAVPIGRYTSKITAQL
jgi:hypothetical protein